MTILGVVSDTHLPRFGCALPRALIAGLAAARVNRILHCGDLTEMLAAELFSAIAPFDAVAGNNDGDAIRERFGRKKIIVVEGVFVGMVHGDAGRHAAPRNAYDAFTGERVDVICFGHSHRALREQRDGRLMLNPGSPTDKRMNLRYSYATLSIEGGRIVESRLHYYSDRSSTYVPQ